MTAATDSSARVQIVVDGQRFHSTVAILTKYCLLFRLFFDAVSGAADSAWQRRLDAAAAETAAEMRATAPPHIPPAPAAVERGDSDAALWRFVFCGKSDGAVSLLPADVGVVLVHLRKRFESQGTAPELPVRWNEMPLDAQCALARVVLTFGVAHLAEPYGRPAALPGTAGASASATSARERAEEYVRARLESAGPHASAGDDGLVLAREACGRCGVTGHTDANCPH